MIKWIKNKLSKYFAPNYHYENCNFKTYTEQGESFLELKGANSVIMTNCKFTQLTLWEDDDSNEQYDENRHLDDVPEEYFQCQDG